MDDGVARARRVAKRVFDIVLSIIGISEMSNAAQQVNSATYSTLESDLPLAAGYLLLTLPISLASRILERKFHYAA